MRVMKPTKKITLAEVALRWGVHRTTAKRILDRYGREREKFGQARSATVRYKERDIEEVERLAKLRLESPRTDREVIHHG
jgi:hypothetical protein